MSKEIIEVPGASEWIRKGGVPLSAAVKANGFVFVSGLPPMDAAKGGFIKGDIASQTECALEHVKRALEAAGSSLDKAVKVTVYITNAAYFRTVNDIYVRYFGKSPPARTFVNVGSWPGEFDIEIECIALA
ncbi:MAG TPA: RidA family protein [Stellaceae bacterium]|nr:RidA family protein [Stellaceae bacterium]